MAGMHSVIRKKEVVLPAAIVGLPTELVKMNSFIL